MFIRSKLNLIAKVDGMQDVLTRIQVELMAIKDRTYKGMFAAMKHLENQMDTVQPLVPEDTKFMRRSWFILGTGHATPNPNIIAGYRAPYAPIIHEGIIHGRPVRNWTRKGSGMKWLQIHFARNIKEMQLIVAAHAKVGSPYKYGGYAPTWSKSLSERTGNEKGTFDLDL
jgi:hypothetical protein